VAVEEAEQCGRVEVEHAGVGDLLILHPVDADAGKVESVATVGVFDLMAPQHDHVIAIGNDSWIKATRLVWLESIPGSAECQALAQGAIESPIVAALKKARPLLD